MGYGDIINWFHGSSPIGGLHGAMTGVGTQSDASAYDVLNGPAQTNYQYNFGDFISGQYNAARQQAAQNNADYAEWVRNEYSAAQQRQFELYLSNTQVQRAMADLKLLD